ncbi:hypothetical protein [Roseibium sediminis]|uniref:hypothetical protein n=1 Tax=Roseibium sediminis TaxID=1775174 RepID=UPI001AD8D0DC|nr:hypothetical protein [Roseibium sediminis]
MRSVTLLAVLLFLIPVSAKADGTDCVVYATDYANSYVNGDLVGDTVRGGIAGAVAGGEWEGPSGAERGARVGGALGVLNNLGSLPGGWQAMYDMAYQICIQGDASATFPAPLPGQPRSDCGSSAGYNTPGLREPGTGNIRAGSSQAGCP